MRWDYWRESKQMHHVDPKTAASNCNSQWETESDPDSDKRRWDGFYSSNHCHALLQQFWFVMPIFRKKIKRSFDFSCHFFWLESFCNFEKQFWRELSNNGASYYYWTRWVDMLQLAGLTERTFLLGPKLEWFEHNWCYICWQSFFTCITVARNPFLNTYQKVSFKRCAMMN